MGHSFEKQIKFLWCMHTHIVYDAPLSIPYVVNMSLSTHRISQEDDSTAIGECIQLNFPLARDMHAHLLNDNINFLFCSI